MAGGQAHTPMNCGGRGVMGRQAGGVGLAGGAEPAPQLCRAWQQPPSGAPCSPLASRPRHLHDVGVAHGGHEGALLLQVEQLGRGQGDGLLVPGVVLLQLHQQLHSHRRLVPVGQKRSGPGYAWRAGRVRGWRQRLAAAAGVRAPWVQPQAGRWGLPAAAAAACDRRSPGQPPARRAQPVSPCTPRPLTSAHSRPAVHEGSGAGQVEQVRGGA